MAAHLGFTTAPSLRETLESAIRETEEDKEDGISLSQEERLMLLNVLEFGETKVSEAMIPRADILAIEENQTVAELLKLFGDAGHSRVPVYRESLDNPVGMVHIKDAIAFINPGEAKPGAKEQDAAGKAIQSLDLSRSALRTTVAAAKLVREVLFVPASMPALALLGKMKAKRIHLALVVDEFGGIDGLATFQDVVEEIIGDIDDEHDVSNEFAIGYENEAFIASARTPIEDVEQVLGIPLTADGASGDIDTLGGLIMAMVGSVPKRMQTIAHPSGVTFEIIEAGPRRIHSVRIRKPRALPGPDKPLLLPSPEGSTAHENSAALPDAKAA